MIKKLREFTGMTQKNFGEWLNIPHRTIQNWEGGQRTPPEYLVELIKYRVEGEIKMFNELKNKFSNAGYVLSKGHSGYSATKDIGYGWTDQGNIITEFKDLDEAAEFLKSTIERRNMTEEDILKEFKEVERKELDEFNKKMKEGFLDE